MQDSGSLPPIDEAMSHTEIQQKISENSVLVQAIYQNQNIGKLLECTQYLELLESNIIELAKTADLPGLTGTDPSMRWIANYPVQSTNSWTKDEVERLNLAIRSFGSGHMEDLANFVATKSQEETLHFLSTHSQKQPHLQSHSNSNSMLNHPRTVNPVNMLKRSNQSLSQSGPFTPASLTSVSGQFGPDTPPLTSSQNITNPMGIPSFGVPTQPSSSNPNSFYFYVPPPSNNSQSTSSNTVNSNHMMEIDPSSLSNQQPSAMQHSNFPAGTLPQPYGNPQYTPAPSSSYSSTIQFNHMHNQGDPHHMQQQQLNFSPHKQPNSAAHFERSSQSLVPPPNMNITMQPMINSNVGHMGVQHNPNAPPLRSSNPMILTTSMQHQQQHMLQQHPLQQHPLSQNQTTQGMSNSFQQQRSNSISFHPHLPQSPPLLSQQQHIQLQHPTIPDGTPTIGTVGFSGVTNTIPAASPTHTSSNAMNNNNSSSLNFNNPIMTSQFQHPNAPTSGQISFQQLQNQHHSMPPPLMQQPTLNQQQQQMCNQQQLHSPSHFLNFHNSPSSFSQQQQFYGMNHNNNNNNNNGFDSMNQYQPPHIQQPSMHSHTSPSVTPTKEAFPSSSPMIHHQQILSNPSHPSHPSISISMFVDDDATGCTSNSLSSSGPLSSSLNPSTPLWPQIDLNTSSTPGGLSPQSAHPLSRSIGSSSGSVGGLGTSSSSLGHRKGSSSSLTNSSTLALPATGVTNPGMNQMPINMDKATIFTPSNPPRPGSPRSPRTPKSPKSPKASNPTTPVPPLSIHSPVNQT